MTETSAMPERVHLVGSIGLDRVDEVFHTPESLREPKRAARRDAR